MPTAEQIQRVLERAPVARLATLAADGPPNVVPIVFVMLEHAIWSPVDGKPKRSTELKRLGNLRRDPRCALLIDRYEDDWRQLWWLRLDCEAIVHRPSPDDPLVARLERALRSKYPQYGRDLAPLRAPVCAFELRVLKTTSWAADASIWSRPFD